MANPINYVPLNTPLFDGSGDPDGKEMVRKLGRIDRTWAVFFGSESGWVSQGTHADRLASNPGAVPDGGLFAETDRQSIYESRFAGSAQAWVFVLGRMSGTLASRPADLGTNDAGFLFSATDALDYTWSGGAWVTLDTVRGGTNLTHVGRVTKVSAAGTLTESSLTDDGAKVSGTEPLNLDTGATPAATQVLLNANGDGVLSLLCYAVDNQQIGFDMYRAGGNDKSSLTATSVARIIKNAAKLLLHGNSPVTPNANVSTNLYITLDLATGFLGLGGKTNPAYAGDATGDHNVSGVYRVAGTQVVTTKQGTLPATAPNGTAAGIGYLQATAATWVTLMNQNKARLDQLEAYLQAHGLIT